MRPAAERWSGRHTPRRSSPQGRRLGAQPTSNRLNRPTLLERGVRARRAKASHTRRQGSQGDYEGPQRGWGISAGPVANTEAARSTSSRRSPRTASRSAHAGNSCALAAEIPPRQPLEVQRRPLGPTNPYLCRSKPRPVSKTPRAPGRSRTRNLTGRNRLLCPVELQGRTRNRSERGPAHLGISGALWHTGLAWWA